MKAKFNQTIAAVLACCTWSVFALDAAKTPLAPEIDGLANDLAWQQTQWHALDQHILGQLPASDDFNGRYKLRWDQQRLYLLAEIVDDVLFDQSPDPLESYWDDDCLEVFIDEDRSGGDHQLNFNAFAYHIALDNQVVDIGPNNPDGSTQFILLNDHIKSAWKRDKNAPHKVIWELAIAVYDDSFTLGANHKLSPISQSKPVKLKPGKKMGFMLAYCDNDGSKNREHFMGSHAIAPKNGDKNLGYIDASVFGELVLVD